MSITQYAYIETFGCQMNERDSEIMSQLLSKQYHRTTELEKAQLVVVNTCSIRGKAEQKAFSLIGRLRRMKKKNPHMLIAVAGCVAQQEGENIRKKMPHVDIVIGPQNIYRLPKLLDLAKKNGMSPIATEQKSDFSIPPFLPAVEEGNTYKRFVTIMQGCNNFCTYCVVPYTRGREISRSFEDIIDEISHLAARGVQEVTLLGQNVNSYGLDRYDNKSKKFPGLIRAASAIKGIKRIRFTTSHPKDLSEELMRCFAEIEELCPHFHLPVQSGSNSILKRMNRKYRIEDYLAKVAKLKTYRPEIALTTDIIVGFPGETDADFNATMDLLEKVRYHGAFSFKYSDRPQAVSAAFDNKVDEEIKMKRLAVLQKRQDEIILERNREYIGQTMPVMIEGKSKNSSSQWSGRTASNHIVNFESRNGRVFNPGDIISVQISEACQNSLRALPVG